jgi:hypothetical protein
MPEIPAIQKPEAQAIRQTLVLSRLRWRGLQIASMPCFQFSSLFPLSTLDQLTSTREVGCRLLWTHANGFEGAISIFGHQRLLALKQVLGVAHHMRFTHLMMHAYLISPRLEAVGIIGDQDRRSHALGKWLNPVLKRLHILCWQRING